MGRQAEDLSGERFGEWLVLRRDGATSSGQSRWLCECGCGAEQHVRRTLLKDGSSQRCMTCSKSARKGKAVDKAESEIGKTYGLLSVKAVGRKRQRTILLCECSCGAEVMALAYDLRSGSQVSCGCYRRKAAAERRTTHGLSKTIEYKSWSAMIWRCSPRATGLARKYYYDKGIRVCPQWCGEGGFEQFLEDVGKRPSLDYSIGRLDGDGHYRPGNARWESRDEQARNKRNVRLISHNGETHTIAEWQRLTGKPIRSRLQRGKSISEAFS